MQINKNKSIFNVTKIKYLGYTIDGRGISPDEDRAQALQKAPKPTTKEELRSLLGFLQFYSRFVPGFSDLAHPLFELMEHKEFKWTPEAQKSHSILIKCILQGNVLKSFEVGAPSELTVDASEYALGAVLEQKRQPIIFISRKLSKAEENYSQTQKDALAIFWAIRRLHKYLFGAKFKIITDHQALKHIFHPQASIAKATSAMLQRWSLELSAYTFDIEHHSGKKIPQADFLSRFA